MLCDNSDHTTASCYQICSTYKTLQPGSPVPKACLNSSVRSLWCAIGVTSSIVRLQPAGSRFILLHYTSHARQTLERSRRLIFIIMAGKDSTSLGRNEDAFAPVNPASISNDDVSAVHQEKPEGNGGPVDPFGDEVGAAVQYKTMKWWQGAMGRDSLYSRMFGHVS